MKYIFLFLLSGWMSVKGQAINSQHPKITEIYCPVSDDHRHHFDMLEKCNQPTCGALCKCGAKLLYKTKKIILPKKK